MKFFVTGTDTNIGKTLVSSWLCFHTRYDYFKPIQTGSSEGTDRETVSRLTGVQTFPEAYCYKTPVSPHLAAELEGDTIVLESIILPNAKNLIVEGAGGVLTPLNSNALMVDLMRQFNLPTLLVASTRLGTINHTLLSLEALQSRHIRVLGVILSGPKTPEAAAAIAHYGRSPILAHLPSTDLTLPLPESLKYFF
ncbi:MAG: dethiobiotin synthase [Verrucomicrobia bacterium GWF2_51_19]|nr:MAG: dethiobiotin synthase [Verrucomicrobia bacterium GWF2_51_19]HCJ11818.1 dethiobiotin synthase [Opitutae bacterium]